MTLFDYYDEFLDYLSAEKNASHHTLKNYASDFKLFFNFLQSNGIKPELETIDTPTIRKYISFLKNEKEFKNNTIRRKIHSLSSFFQYLLEQEYIMKNPMLPIHAPKIEQTIPVYLSREEIELLLNMPMKYGKENALRDKCILETFVYTGMRRQELLGLNWEDIDFGRQEIVVRKGKGKKQRMIPIKEPLVSDLWAYLQTRLPLTNNATFISETGNRLSPTSVQLMFTKYIKKAGLDGKGYTIHKLRHSFATHMIQNGADLITVQNILGHADLNNTKIYTHTDTNHLREQLDKLPF